MRSFVKRMKGELKQLHVPAGRAIAKDAVFTLAASFSSAAVIYMIDSGAQALLGLLPYFR